MITAIQAVQPYLSAVWTSGVAGASAIASYATGNLARVGTAVKAAVSAASIATGMTAAQLYRMPMWPVWARFTPTIYGQTAGYLAVPVNQRHYVLRFNGFLSPRTIANRLWVKATWGGVVTPATKAVGLDSLDEFPYASTRQGGPFGPAVGWPVPLQENLVQGGLLVAFYTYVMRGLPRRFLVVPIP